MKTAERTKDWKPAVLSTKAPDVIALLRKVATGKNHVPVLNCVLAKGGTLTAYDCAIRLTVKQPAPMKDGLYAYNSKIKQFAKSTIALDEAPVPFAHKDHCKAEFALDARQATAFRAALLACSFAHSTDATRYILTGVCVDLDNHCLVATDGKRLHRVELPDILTGAGKYILPSALVALLLAEKSAEQPLVLRLGEESCEIEDAFVSISANLIQGTYPNYRQVIPAECKHSCVCITQHIAQAVTDVAPFATADAECTATSLRLAFTKTELTVIAENGDKQFRRKATVECTESVGTPVAKLGVDPDFMQEALAATMDTVVHIHAIAECSPLVLRTDSGFTAVVMPMRLS